MSKKNALLLFGGKSFEHDISIITALIIYNNAKYSNYNLLPVYIDRNNEWFFYSQNDLKIGMFKDFKESSKKFGFKKIYFKLNQNAIFYKQFLKEVEIKIDVCLNCCHGGVGEDGTITSFLNLINIPSSVQSSASLGVCMDKILTKHFAEGLNIATIDYQVMTAKQFNENQESSLKQLEKLGYPLIIKPAKLGSSIGIEVVENKSGLEKALKTAFEFDNTLLVEKAILDNMTEYNVACMRYKGEILISQIDKPIRADQILSFKDKYIGEQSDLSKANKKGSVSQKNGQKGGQFLSKKSFEPVSPKIKKIVEQYAKKLYESLDLNGVVRIDFICNKKGKVYFNEVNSVPGSLAYYFFVPYKFKTMNHYINALLDETINYHDQKKRIKQEYITNLF